MAKPRQSSEYTSPVARDIRRGLRLPGNRFGLYTHCTRQGDKPHEIWDFEKGVPREGWSYVGWCPSGATPIPNSNWPGLSCQP